METVNNKPENDLSRFRVTANDEIPMNDAILFQGDRRLISIGDISVITGQPKSRKTFLVSALCAAYLSETGYLGLTPGIDGKILLVDTEQSRPFVLNVIKRIYRILNWNFEDIHSEEIDVLSLRELSANERLVTLEKAIKEFVPRFVIVDGFADLLLDTNSLEESTKKVFDLMRFSTVYNCHICTVVHTNPNSEKMRGHTGSELQRKSETVLLVTKSDEVSTVSPQFCRNIEFNKFSFRIDSNGLPVSCEFTPSPEDNNKILFESIFLVSPSFKYSDLRNEVMRRLGIKSTAAENRIKKGLEAGILDKDVNSIYSLRFEEEDKTMPF